MVMKEIKEFLLVLLIVLLITSIVVSIGLFIKYKVDKIECEELYDEGYDTEFYLNMSFKNRKNPMWGCNGITIYNEKVMYDNGHVYYPNKDIIKRR